MKAEGKADELSNIQGGHPEIALGEVSDGLGIKRFG
jgi:hypothetical protein